MNSLRVASIASLLLTAAPAVAAPPSGWVETTYQCGYTVSVKFSDRDVDVIYRGILDEKGCRPLSVILPRGSVRHYGANRTYWEFNGNSGTADGYANALAALPDEALIYLDPTESIVTKVWGF